MQVSFPVLHGKRTSESISDGLDQPALMHVHLHGLFSAFAVCRYIYGPSRKHSANSTDPNQTWDAH